VTAFLANEHCRAIENYSICDDWVYNAYYIILVFSEKHNHCNIAHDNESQEPQEDVKISGDCKENDDELIKVRPLTRQ